MLQEFFAFPEKFLFLNLDLKDWQERGDGQSVQLTFYCEHPPFSLPHIGKENFDLYAVPAVNLFPEDADPILWEHKQEAVRLQPSAGAEKQTIFSVDAVTGLRRGETQKRAYSAFSDFQFGTQTTPVYQVRYQPSTQNQHDPSLQIIHPPQESLPASEVLSVELTCSNGTLPESLRIGEICKPTSNTPEVVTYRNITRPSMAHFPQLQGDLLWRLLANFSVASKSITDVENFKAMLSKYVIHGGRDKPKEIANQKRIQAITALEASLEERIFERAVYRGQAIRLKVNSEQYVSRGDMYLFGVILNHFLGTYSSFNTYVHFSLEDIIQWEVLPWPARMGTRPLL